MFKKIIFFVEGVADRRFIQDFIEIKFNLKIENSKFIIIGSNNENAIRAVKNEFSRSRFGID